MAKDLVLNRKYELLLKKRAENVARNAAEGRTMQMTGNPLQGSAATPSDSLSDLLGNIKSNNGLVQNTQNIVKTTGADTLGIDPKIVYKSKFPSTSKALSLAEDVGESTLGRALKSERGSASVVPMLGLGAAALGGIGVAKKLEQGDYGNAALDAADIGTDFIPGVGLAKMLLRPTEAGAADIPDDEMRQREIFNAARKAKDGTPVNNPSTEAPLIEPENRAKREDLNSLFKNTMSRIK